MFILWPELVKQNSIVFKYDHCMQTHWSDMRLDLAFPLSIKTRTSVGGKRRHWALALKGSLITLLTLWKAGSNCDIFFRKIFGDDIFPLNIVFPCKCSYIFLILWNDTGLWMVLFSNIANTSGMICLCQVFNAGLSKTTTSATSQHWYTLFINIPEECLPSPDPPESLLHMGICTYRPPHSRWGWRYRTWQPAATLHLSVPEKKDSGSCQEENISN